MKNHKKPPFPIFLSLDGAEVLLVGEGGITARRAETALRTGARVKLITPSIGPALAHIAGLDAVTVHCRPFEESDLDECRMVLVVSDNEALCTRISNLAQARRIPVNVADNIKLCSFIMPAIVNRAPMMVAVTSGGAAPVLTRYVKTAIEAALPADLGDIAAYAGSIRDRVNSAIPDSDARRYFWQEFADGPIAALIAKGETDTVEKLISGMVSHGEVYPSKVRTGEVIIIGTGSGDPDMLPLRALRLMQRGDIIVHEAVVPAAILDLARKDAEREIAMSPDDTWINVRSHAERGLRVLWVVSGTPELPPEAAESDLTIRVVPAAG